MIACLAIPAFELRAALRRRPSVALQPAALAPPDGAEPLIGSVTSAADQAGVRPGMRMGEALATCPKLVLVEPDPASAERDWEEIVRSLEDSGFAVQSAGLGTASTTPATVSASRCGTCTIPSTCPPTSTRR